MNTCKILLIIAILVFLILLINKCRKENFNEDNIVVSRNGYLDTKDDTLLNKFIKSNNKNLNLFDSVDYQKALISAARIQDQENKFIYKLNESLL